MCVCVCVRVRACVCECVYKQDMPLKKQQWLIWHKTKANQNQKNN